MSDVLDRNVAAVAAYHDRFPQEDLCVGHPQLLAEDGLAEYLMEAIERGTPLTEADLEAKFGEISWDW